MTKTGLLLLLIVLAIALTGCESARSICGRDATTDPYTNITKYTLLVCKDLKFYALHIVDKKSYERCQIDAIVRSTEEVFYQPYQWHVKCES